MKSVTSRDDAPDSWDDRDKPVDLTAALDVLVQYRWTFFLAAGLVFALGLIYAMLAQPVYQADILVQVEESNATPGANKAANSVSPVFDPKSASSAEVELLRSRMVVGKAVDSLHLDIVAAPRYFPVIGAAIARRNSELSTPGLFGMGGYAWGDESISVSRLDMPAEMENRKILVTSLGNQQFQVSFASDDAKAVGKVGTPLSIVTSTGTVDLTVAKLSGRAGAQFTLTRLQRAAAIGGLQQKLSISERGKQSGVIAVSLDGTSPTMTAAILNEIGYEYVDQNVRRKAAEAEKSLNFLEQQLPQLKQQVEAAETKYNAMRNQRGTIDLSEESKLILSQSVGIQTKIQELRQKRQELAARFTSNHPSLEIIDGQIGSLSAQLNGVSGKIQKLPDVEQNVLRLMRDVKVNTELYQALLNDVQQLRMVRASKVGTARLVDTADVPVLPIRPARMAIAAMAAVLGVIVGFFAIFLRHTMAGGLTDADDVERLTGLTVYATIPHSDEQVRAAAGKSGEPGVLAMSAPDDSAVESLRSFRTALQFALLSSRNRLVVISGAAPGVGKSFICANFATVLAAGGKRVVLVDADLRRGSLNHRFGVRRTPGLTEMLMGTPLEQVIQRDVVPGLDFIATGAAPPHPADMLHSPAMESLLDTLKMRYDIVLVDSPPVLAASDAGILASKAGAVFLVARAEATTVNELRATERAIQHAGGEVKGVLFNGLKVEGRWYRSHHRFGQYRYMSQYTATNAKSAANSGKG
jgi:tyrosine-protein kinase Etk/Wzc